MYGWYLDWWFSMGYTMKDMDADASDGSSMDWNDASGYDMDWYGLNLSITFYDYMVKMCWCWCWWIFHGWYDYYVESMEVELRFRFGIEDGLKLLAQEFKSVRKKHCLNMF